MANFHLSLRLGGDATFRATLAFSLCHFLFLERNGLQEEGWGPTGPSSRACRYFWRANKVQTLSEKLHPTKITRQKRHWIWLEVETYIYVLFSVLNRQFSFSKPRSILYDIPCPYSLSFFSFFNAAFLIFCLLAHNNMFDILFLWSFKRSSDSADQLADWVDSSQWPEVSFEQQRFSLKLFFVFAWGSDWSKNDWNGKIFSRISRKLIECRKIIFFLKICFPLGTSLEVWGFLLQYTSALKS